MDLASFSAGGIHTIDRPLPPNAGPERCWPALSGYEATRVLSARYVATTGTSLGKVRTAASGSLAADHVR
jgi:hypothetical protein